MLSIWEVVEVMGLRMFTVFVEGEQCQREFNRSDVKVRSREFFNLMFTFADHQIRKSGPL